MRSQRLVTTAAAIFISGVVLSQCSNPAPAPGPAPGEAPVPVVSVRELMQTIIDPLADNIFDAVATDVTEKGLVEHRPTTDEDWAKVMQGAVALAEGTNLLKMHPRLAAPADYTFDPKERGPGAPELAPAEIQKKIDADPALWNMHANALREEAIKVMAIVKARDADKLFEAGSDIDKACETCHLEYWYPGDKKTVLEDAAKRVTSSPQKK
jgi:cytochrome c556